MESKDKANNLLGEVWDILNGLGYEIMRCEDHIVVEGTIAPRHMNAIRAILGGYLWEFFWINGIATIYVKDKNEGLDPDDTRYNTLLRCMYNINPDKNPVGHHENEIFVNLDDHVERVIVDEDNVDEILSKQKKLS